MVRNARFGVAVVCLVGCLSSVSISARPGNSEIPANMPKLLHIVFTSGMVAEMNPHDAAAAVQVFGEQIIKRRGLAMHPRVSICDGISDLQKLIKNEEADLVSLRIDEYLKLEYSSQFQNAFMGMRNENWSERYVLLTRNSDGLRNLADLRGKRLLSLSGRRTGLADEWLNTVLIESNLPEAAEFFGQVRTVPKISAAVLPVFFKQMDACLVTQSGFETMTQLNPQLGKELSAIKVSPSILPSLVCLKRDLIPFIKEGVHQALVELHQEVSGRQVLTLFSIDKLVPLTSANLTGAVEVYSKYRRIARKTPLSTTQSLRRTE